MNIKKLLKIIGIVLIVAIILLMIHAFRNYIVVKRLKTNFNKYNSSNNYHIKSIAKESEETTVVMDYYVKDDKKAVIMERINPEETVKLSMYDNGERVDVFTDNGEEKTCMIDVDTELLGVQLVNYLETENDWQTFLSSFFARIKKGEFDQKECYVIDNYTSPLFMYDPNKNEVYIEKDTGLFVKSTIGSMITEREYEFDSVEDSAFSEPDISEYRIDKNE